MKPLPMGRKVFLESDSGQKGTATAQTNQVAVTFTLNDKILSLFQVPPYIFL